MSVRKRKWTTTAGVAKEAWVVDCLDGDGTRRLKTFARKKDADAWHATVNVEVARGVHTPDSKSLTVVEAAEQWLAFVEIVARERSTVDQYRQHVTLHIVPRIRREKLSKLTTPRIQAFRDDPADGHVAADGGESADEPEDASQCRHWRKRFGTGGTFFSHKSDASQCGPGCGPTLCAHLRIADERSLTC